MLFFTFPPQQCFKVSINKEVHLIRELLQSKISLNMTSCMYVLERKPICSSLPRPPLGLGSNHLSFFVAFPFFFLCAFWFCCCIFADHNFFKLLIIFLIIYYIFFSVAEIKLKFPSSLLVSAIFISVFHVINNIA